MRNSLAMCLVVVGSIAFGSGREAQADIVNSWDANGVPDNLAPHNEIPSSTFQAVQLALPEVVDIRESHPEYIASDEQVRVTLNETAEVFVTFLHEGAGYRNALGCFFYDAASPPTSAAQVQRELIFPNVSYAGSGGGLASGMTIDLGAHEAGTSVGFWITANAWSGGAPNLDRPTYYSISSLNPESTDDLRRHMVLLWQENEQDLVLALEDLNRESSSCDHDFNDAAFLVWSTPSDAIDLSSIVDLPGEGDTDGDGVPDYLDTHPDDPERASVQYTPSVSGYEVLAFEDMWPDVGDYDFNDLVVRYRFRETLDAAGRVKETRVAVEPLARGAAHHNGLAMSLSIGGSSVESVRMWRDQAEFPAEDRLEVGAQSVVVRLIEDQHDWLSGTSPSGFANTIVGEAAQTSDILEASVVFTIPVERATLGSPPYDPFLFKSQSRGHEIHLVDRPPTEFAFDVLFGTGDDTSDAGLGRWYRDTSGFPWAMILPTTWAHPKEQSQLSWAYPYFATWVESQGRSPTDWTEAGRVWEYLWND